MIVLLSYLNSWSENDAMLSPTGEVTKDSVLVAIDDLRVANAKMIELKYEKEINRNLREIVKNDSIAIEGLQLDNRTIEARAKKYKKERNIVGGTGIGVLILLVISLISLRKEQPEMKNFFALSKYVRASSYLFTP